MCSATVKIFGVENEKLFYNDEFTCKTNKFFNGISGIFGLEDEVTLERVSDCKIQKRMSFDMNNNNCAVLDSYYDSNSNALKVISIGNSNWGNDLLMLEDLVISASPRINQKSFVLEKENFKIFYSYTKPIKSYNDLEKVSRHEDDYRVVINKEEVDLHHVHSIVETENGMKIYFDNIAASSEIRDNNFIVKMANNQDFIVHGIKISEYDKDARTMKLEFLNFDTSHSIVAHKGDENSFSVEWYF